MRAIYRTAEIVMLIGATIAIAGCTTSMSADGKTIHKDRLQAEVAKRVTMDPERAADVHCAGGLKGAAGATQQCQVASGGSTAAYIVTATVADGSDILFDVRPDKSPAS